MNQPDRCRHCGAALSADASQPLCTACLAASQAGRASEQAPIHSQDEATVELPATDKMGGDAAMPPETAAAGERTIAFPPGQTISSLADDAEPLRSFGDYELVEEVARGGMGVVYRARQVSLNRVVALKMILAGQFASGDDVRRFHTEAEAVANLDHVGIVPIYEVGQHEGQHYFTMGFIEGQSLHARLKLGPLKAHDAAKMVKRIAEAIAYAHRRGFLHRDLKPGNVLIDASGEPKLTDFGLAKKLQDDMHLTTTGEILGTPNYMSPEQAAGRPVGHATDIYSLGAILYSCLTGRPPFEGDTPLDTLVQVIESEPTLPSKLRGDVPRDLELICIHCLEKDPERRYATAAEVAQDLDRFLMEEPVHAQPAGIWPRLRRWARREPALASHLIALAAMAIIIQIAYLTLGDDFAYYLRNILAVAVWAGLCVLFQRMMETDRWGQASRFLWAAADVGLVTFLLATATGGVGPLLIAYALLVAASGLFFQVRLVVFTTAVCLLSYGALLFFQPLPRDYPHYGAIFAVLLALLGYVVAFQVHRVRVLSRYYNDSRLQ